MLLVLVPALFAQTQPATTSDSVRPLVLELNDRDAAARDHAAQQLMDLTYEDLPALRDIVATCRPLSPSQAVLLHDVVCQIYLSKVDYPTEDRPFLGISYPQMQGYSNDNDPSVRVVTRYAGFSSFQMLREGDIIFGVAGEPALQLNTNSLTNIISGRKVGDSIDLLVIRHGRQITVTCHLRPKPMGNSVEALDSWSASRQQQAEKYWRTQFAKLLEPEAS